MQISSKVSISIKDLDAELSWRMNIGSTAFGNCQICPAGTYSTSQGFFVSIFSSADIVMHIKDSTYFTEVIGL